jgi:hypothetical protein
MESGHYGLTSFEAVACHYLDEYAAEADRQLRWFADPSLALTQIIGRACASRLADGRLHNHQQRPFGVWPQAPGNAAANLRKITSRLIDVGKFDALHETIRLALLNVQGIGELADYDISHRIGAWLRLQPTEVYLHRGTRKGAEILGLPLKGRSIPMDALPEGLRRLTAGQAEDALCIYRADFSRIIGSSEGSSPIRRRVDRCIPLRRAHGCGDTGRR